MAKYQLGTVLLAGRETIILACGGAYFDLGALLKKSDVRTALALDEHETPASLMEMLERWSFWQLRLPQIVDEALTRQETEQIAGETLRWRPPLLYPRKLICIGTNYKDHIAEMGGSTLPSFPYSFFKPPTTTLIGAGEAVTLPEYAQMIDWEVELAVVIGQRARGVRGQEAMNCAAGYSILNDISARDWLLKPTPIGIDWVMSKAADGFAPMGPLITPAEFVPDPQALRLTLSVNGVLKQNSNTNNMVFSVREIIEHLAAIMTLEPGDVIATGTPAGVGFGRKPPELLKAGDHMVAEIEGLGRLETPVQ
jgi:2,4-diketo-3-deoxy-L-fuconate hydrolase